MQDQDMVMTWKYDDADVVIDDLMCDLDITIIAFLLGRELR